MVKEFKKNLKEGINKTLKEKYFFLLDFEEESISKIIRNIKFEITLEEFNDFLIFRL